MDADVLVLQGAAADTAPAWTTAAVVLTDDAPAWLTSGDVTVLALLPPSTTPAQLRAAVAAVMGGLSVRDPRWAFGSPAFHADGADHEPLTARELEVYELLGKGLSNRDIAGVLGISAHTAKYHVGQILAKVSAATRAEAVSVGLRMGIIGL